MNQNVSYRNLLRPAPMVWSVVNRVESYRSSSLLTFKRLVALYHTLIADVSRGPKNVESDRVPLSSDGALQIFPGSCNVYRPHWVYCRRNFVTPVGVNLGRTSLWKKFHDMQGVQSFRHDTSFIPYQDRALHARACLRAIEAIRNIRFDLTKGTLINNRNIALNSPYSVCTQKDSRAWIF